MATPAGQGLVDPGAVGLPVTRDIDFSCDVFGENDIGRHALTFDPVSGLVFGPRHEAVAGPHHLFAA